ncbi:MAG: HAMP domain-containing histidine kinase [Gammaproteobacteria bacterium]|nr:MAG: HAMP domain-containing histidine kinase [Gammaproteobacteria bacterium]
MHQNSLKRRIIVTTVIIVTVVSTLFAGCLLLIKQRLEESTFGRLVHEHLEILINEPQSAEILSHELFKEWRFYRGDNVAELPGYVRALPPGSYHSIDIDHHYYHLQVEPTPQGKVYLTYDVTEWEEQEHALLATLFYGVLVVLIVAVIMANRSSRIILSPVRALTDRLANIEPGERGVRIAGEFRGSEIGQIASAFDTYSARLDQFVERERSFTASASHELRTPLSVMMGAVDVLDTNVESPLAERALARIKRACGEMQAFIEATLFLSREGGGSINQGKVINVAELLREVVEDNRDRIAAAGIEVQVNAPSLLSLDVPASIAKITLNNILLNAIEHSEGGSIRVDLEGGRLTFADTGVGIPPEQLPHVFDRSYTTKPSGTGMGLNLVKRICDRFNWQIEIDSEPGQGTTVVLNFPGCDC